jgi:amino acid transporter
VDQHILTSGRRSFLVQRDRAVLGLLTLHRVVQVPRTQWTTTTAEQAMIPAARMKSARPDTELKVGLTEMDRDGVSQLPVMDLVLAKLLVLTLFCFLRAPRAILLSLAISTAFYVSVGLVAVGLVGASRPAASGSPLTEAIQVTGSQAAGRVVSAGGMLATASVLLTSVLGVSRVAYAMARSGDLPGVFGRLHPTHDTPSSVWITGASMAAVVLLVDLTKVVAVRTFALLFYYGVANACALRLKTPARVYPRIVPALGVSTCLGLLVALLATSPRAWLIGIATLVGGALYYAAKGRLLHQG